MTPESVGLTCNKIVIGKHSGRFALGKKLEEMGYISWDRTTNKIKKGPEWDDIAPVLKLMHDHQDELPEGWL